MKVYQIIAPLCFLFMIGTTTACSDSDPGGDDRTDDLQNQIVVALDGSGDFFTVQEAIDKSAQEVKPVYIYIKKGIYKEKISIDTGNNNLHFIGEDPENTVITYDDYSGKSEFLNTFNSYTVKIEADSVSFKNITIENSEGLRGQAVALHVDGDRCTFCNCRILGNQDTVYANGTGNRQYFKDCYIDGTTDFIFGSATALFDGCIIVCKKNSYITAASTAKESEFGFVFLSCQIKAQKGITSVFLGRPWRDYARVVYLKCELGNFIRVEGWHNWSKPEREKTVFFAEYMNYGEGANVTKRVAWSKQLTEEQARSYTIENILQEKIDL